MPGIRRIRGFAGRYFRAVCRCAQLLTVGTLTRQGRRRLDRLLEIFRKEQDDSARERERPEPVVPQAAFPAATLDATPIKICAPRGVGGNITTIELVFINKVVVQTAPKRLFEIGTFDGRTTINLAANSPSDAHVFTLDLPRTMLDDTKLPLESCERAYIDKEKSGILIAGHEAEGKITQLCGDSATFDFSPHWGQMDFVFVDGSHSYEYVLSDSRIAMRLLRGGRGTIVWHDYNKPSGYYQGVTRALNELYESGGPFGRMRRVEGTTLAVLRLGQEDI